MKRSIYASLARTGLKRNRRITLPYLLTCVGMVTMFYLITAISHHPILAQMKGGNNLSVILGLGKWVVGIFALIFLFYTNSFLLRSRSREFGLYSVLGMNKRNIGRIVCWETLFTAGIGLIGGLIFGLLLLRAAELGLLSVIHEPITAGFPFSWDSLRETAIVFGTIFLLLWGSTLLRVRKQNPLELMRSENYGEKPPKANWLLAVLGALCLGIAYYMAVTIQGALTALLLFFIAVILVIAATYLLFTAGSVVLCRILQKNPKYYYKKEHFVSVSSMRFRMKRNGAGLASICVLCTMILVMLSATFGLYLGTEDSIRSRYPRDINVELSLFDYQGNCALQEEQLQHFSRRFQDTLEKNGLKAENLSVQHYADISGIWEQGSLKVHAEDAQGEIAIQLGRVCTLYVVPLSEYEAFSGSRQELKNGEVLVLCNRTVYTEPTLQIEDGPIYRVKQNCEGLKLPENGTAASLALPTVFVVTGEYEKWITELDAFRYRDGSPMAEEHWYYGFDLPVSDEETERISAELYDDILAVVDERDLNHFGLSCGNVPEQRKDFYSIYGGLLYIGIILSVVFLFAAILMIYYKQLSEGTEDRSRFAIMQKVGMTQRDIRRSIDSQVRTVFFAPLAASGIHLCFAFPMIWKLLQLFMLNNLSLMILTTAAAFLCFSVFYVLVYKVTSHVYYGIVSGKRDE